MKKTGLELFEEWFLENVTSETSLVRIHDRVKELKAKEKENEKGIISKLLGGIL